MVNLNVLGSNRAPPPKKNAPKPIFIAHIAKYLQNIIMSFVEPVVIPPISKYQD